MNDINYLPLLLCDIFLDITAALYLGVLITYFKIDAVRVRTHNDKK